MTTTRGWITQSQDVQLEQKPDGEVWLTIQSGAATPICGEIGVEGVHELAEISSLAVKYLELADPAPPAADGVNGERIEQTG